MSRLPQILNRHIVARSRLFTVEALDLRFGNGVEARFERLRSSLSGAVLVVPVTDDDRLVLIREYGAGVERYELGFPKGKVDPGEGWAEASVRECIEEAGYRPGSVRLLDTVTLSAGYMSHVTHLVLAEALVPASATGDEPEPLEVVHWPLDDWRALVDDPDFTEGRAYAALLRALQARGRL
ncbi:ADP compounds hydrolase NudE [Sulfurivirga sp.]|uniref:ADP compounds hydrolase NudE n=1 Tax=Sulfurivirga sp. TaxID=2614236 RepID=UPI0025FCE8C8|nr:ADP compounds hydrolase NudE [Sulfurivirga sp.]